MANFQIALINVFWSESDINTRFFNSVAEQNTYFQGLTSGNFSPLVNFNMGNNVETSIIYRDTSNRSVRELLRCNYAVVQETNEAGSVVSRRYFFAYPYQDSGRQLRVTLSLDDIQTNYFRYKTQIAPCVIRRACLDRFVNFDPTPSQLVKFNGNLNSKLFEREALQNVSKRLTSRTKISLNNYFEQSEVNDWLDENVLFWCYVFVDPNHAYNFNVDLSTGTAGATLAPGDTYVNSKGGTTTGTMSRMTTEFACFAFPVMKSDKTLNIDQHSRTSENRIFQLNGTAFDIFQTYNNDASFIYDVRTSSVHPFGNSLTGNQSPATVQYEIDTDGNLHLRDNFISLRYERQDFQNGTAYATGYDTRVLSLFKVNNQVGEVESQSFRIPISTYFNKSQFLSNKNVKFNPKLLNSDYMTFAIGDETGEYFEYDLQKLNNYEFSLVVTEPFTPGITKTYVRIKDPQGVYIPETMENFTGFVGSNDRSLARATSQYASTLANNKNFFLQNQYNRNMNALAGGIGTGTQFLSGNVGAGISSGLSGMLSYATSLQNEYFTVDNMKNAPADIKSAQGNSILNVLVCPPAIYYSIYEILPNEKEMINDYMVMYGFNVGLIGNLSEYDNIRYRFNYIEADVEVINAPISNLEKTRLIQKLKGVRFWNSDSINYTLENFERWLTT